MPTKQKKPMKLSQKANEISSLALANGTTYSTAHYFIDHLKLRTVLKRQLERCYQNRLKRKKALINALGGKSEANRVCIGINEWLEKMKRPELKLTFDEFLNLILE